MVSLQSSMKCTDLRSMSVVWKLKALMVRPYADGKFHCLRSEIWLPNGITGRSYCRKCVYFKWNPEKISNHVVCVKDSLCLVDACIRQVAVRQQIQILVQSCWRLPQALIHIHPGDNQYFKLQHCYYLDREFKTGIKWSHHESQFILLEFSNSMSDIQVQECLFVTCIWQHSC